ncbi:exonuclease domain-containing protein [Actinospica robiniae]|uniref:exonuclease domain-containing protein n=1 Tax=Actinospica robiniae TaxID=304901 RepID=UPI0003F4F717|nr:exonuclease domain-containing protein [Actinospica robiniae]
MQQPPSTRESWVAIDFETANLHGASVWEVGMVAVSEQWAPIATFHRLIRPRAPYDVQRRWDPAYALMPPEARDADEFDVVLKEMLEFIDGRLLITHNASFEMKVFEQSCAVFGLPLPDLEFLCSLETARRVWPARSYKLSNLAETLNLQAQPNHRALDDAVTAFRLLEAAARTVDAGGIRELILAAGVRTRQLAAALPRPLAAPDDVSRPLGGGPSSWAVRAAGTRPAPNWFSALTATGPLAGKTILVSGEHGGLSRSDLKSALARAGARAVSAISGRVDILAWDGMASAPGKGIALEAENRKRTGQRKQLIRSIGHEDLMALLKLHAG